ncbi:hypothetical protein TIFTF001_045020 [Ficus carica]|uniref:Uncharacterized protein n=1 Tax=Ficus carica TaxID=3494 RepID=A0AA88A161_FICCA|nr:hypothetical protein TIFTF001_045019 [Ficus carica]GMN35458.1 hypothetical protein TIFTF001_045020 [Ficus carica]
MSSSDMNPANGSPKLQFVRELAADESSDPVSCTLLISSSEMKPTTTTATTKHQSSAAHEESTESKLTQPNNMAGKSNFVKTVTTIFKEKDIDVPISIFKVPNSLISAKAEAYVPHTVGLGPVHHSRRELQHMQMYKVMEAKRIHNGFQSGFEFDEVIEFLENLVGGPSIRASYCIYFDMEDDDLACVMAVDGLFLFDLLCCYGISKDALLNSDSLSHLACSAERRLAHESILQEAMMLENQIPLFVMKVLLIVECSQLTTVRDLFPNILVDFCKFFSPLTITVENYPYYKTLKHAHLLDLLYHLITLKHSPDCNYKEEVEELTLLEELSNKVRPKPDSITPPSPTDIILEEMYDMVTQHADEAREIAYFRTTEQVIPLIFDAGLTFAPQQFLNPLRLIQSLYAELPKFKSLISSTKKEVPAKKVFSFPTASELHGVGVKFSEATHITDIKFDPETASFELPLITLNANFEVIIRNLVAYEAMIKSEKQPPILNWYVELMNGLIKTAKDVEVLRDQGIFSKTETVDEEQGTGQGISSKLESFDDEKVAKIFNGMNKVVELTNIPKNLEDAVKDVKRHYVTKASESSFMDKCRRTAAKWCNLLTIILALFLLTVQTVCSVYECPRFSFKMSSTSQAQQGLQLPSLRSHLS